MRGLIVILTVCLGVTRGGFFDVTQWNSLRVKWDVNFFSSYTFDTMPLTTTDAVAAGFTKLSDCDVNAPWRGQRYIKDGELALILLFDVQGNIAGIQASIPDNLPNGYPKTALQPPFVREGNRWVISAYFTDPSKICTTGRSSSQVALEGTDSNLYIQNSTHPEDSILIPRTLEGIEQTPPWTKGKCVYTMGIHYWWNLTDDMSCDTLFPVFLLYNQGTLNAIGWNFITEIESPRYEHPPQSSFKLFMDPPPTCLKEAGVITTMHIFLNSRPYLNFC